MDNPSHTGRHLHMGRCLRTGSFPHRGNCSRRGRQSSPARLYHTHTHNPARMGTMVHRCSFRRTDKPARSNNLLRTHRTDHRGLPANTGKFPDIGRPSRRDRSPAWRPPYRQMQPD